MDYLMSIEQICGFSYYNNNRNQTKIIKIGQEIMLELYDIKVEHEVLQPCQIYAFHLNTS